MPDLLLELFSEEIPARMQRRAADDLRRLVTDALVERGFLYEGARAFATPRRLALHVAGLPAKGKDVREERRGPRVGAPEAALQGFLKSAGLASIDQAKVEKDAKKGEFYVAVIERPGRPTPEVLAEILPGIVRSFPWPKSMRWGPASREPGSLRWVRPLHSILCTFGPETEDPEIVPFAVDGIRSGDVTRGHRFMAPDPIRVRRLDDYVPALERAKVVLDADRRRDIIRGDAQNLAFARGLELVGDEALLEEVAGLVEWPVALVGTFDDSFLAIPPEVIRATIRANQKCFVLRSPSSSPPGGEGRGEGDQPSPESSLPSPLRGGVGVGFAKSERDGADLSLAGPTALRSSASRSTPATPTPNPSPQGGGEHAGALSNSFILVSNLEATDGGQKIVAGNERVVRARLSDAKFFWETDQKPLPEFSDRPDLKPLDQRLERLKALDIVFHEKLGTQGERVERIAALARELAPVVGADPDLAERAAFLAKADLVTEMVGEFPELQGLMGRYYAAAQGEHPSVAAAIEEHYRPLGPADRVPTDPVSVAVALADKIDTLVGFWASGEKPTGSKDPYALRRAALGVIRLVLENGIRLSTFAALSSALRRFEDPAHPGWIVVGRGGSQTPPGAYPEASSARRSIRELGQALREISPDLLSFFADRLKVYLRDQGARHDLIDAVFSAGASSSPLAGEVARPQAGSEGGRDDRALVGATSSTGSPGGTTPTPDPSPQGGGEPASQGARHDLIDAVYSAAASPPSPGAGESLPSGTDPRVARPNAGSEGGRDEKTRVGATSSTGSPGGTTPTPNPSPQGGGEPAGGATSSNTEASGTTLSQNASPQGGGERAGAVQDDLLMIVRRVEALGRFLDSEDGQNLLAGFRRAANIVRIEEKKDGRAYDGEPDPRLIARGLPEEQGLFAALGAASAEARRRIEAEDFEGAMRALAELRPAVDAFFDKVTVNADDPALRENRLRLLNQFRRATREVADFSKIEG